MALVVLIDAYCTCWDIDARAAKEEKAHIAQTLSDICLALYTMELAMGFLVSGWNLFKDWAVSGQSTVHGNDVDLCTQIMATLYYVVRPHAKRYFNSGTP